MSELKEAIGLSLANLFVVAKHAEAMDSAAQRREALGKLCADTEARLHAERGELKRSQDELRSAEGNLNAKKRIIEDQRNRSNAAIDEQISQAQGQWNGLQAAISKAHRELAEIDASRESLIRRLRI